MESMSIGYCSSIETVDMAFGEWGGCRSENQQTEYEGGFSKNGHDDGNRKTAMNEVKIRENDVVSE